MNRTNPKRDQLFLIAEALSRDFDLFPSADANKEYAIRGLLRSAEIAKRADELERADVDTYIEAVISPAEAPDRLSAPDVVRQIGIEKVVFAEEPYYEAIVEFDFNDQKRQVGVVAQNRAHKNGEWMPEHHLAAAQFVDQCSRRSIPIVSMMDTPGAAGHEEANRNNQAHAISRLITVMSDVDVPNIGVIFGVGYSGGAIPLAASNVILAVRDGVFSTIQPRSLASIARRLNLSWQECAKHVGLSPYELMQQGNIDGIIDYVPGDPPEKLENLRLAIVTCITSVENSTRTFVRENPYIIEHYHRSLERYLNPSQRLQKLEQRASLGSTRPPSEYFNVFGIAFRYLRYLRVRRRIRATSKQQYGRLSQIELPTGELDNRIDRERRRTFLRWLQDPDRLMYDDQLKLAWKVYNERRDALSNERGGRISELLFGEPKKRFEDARISLLHTFTMYLYNRWKTDAGGNLSSLLDALEHHNDFARLLKPSEIDKPKGLSLAIRSDNKLGLVLRERFTHEGKKLVQSLDTVDHRGELHLAQFCVELNLALTEGPLGARRSTKGGRFIAGNRDTFDRKFGVYLVPAKSSGSSLNGLDKDIWEVLTNDDLRDDFIREVRNFSLFDSIYDQLLTNLSSIAEEAGRTQSLSRDSIEQLLGSAFEVASRQIANAAAGGESRVLTDQQTRESFFEWFQDFTSMRGVNRFFQTVEEWKKRSFPQISDTLFVVVTFVLERLVTSYLQSNLPNSKYDGRIAPRRIGRKKDFWNRLNIAYRDLQIHEALTTFKRRGGTEYQAFVSEFFSDFEELFSDRLSTDPCKFPGFRLAIESALKSGSPPCGVVTGVGTFKDGKNGVRVGAVISNVEFQAGAFDMASAEKFCRLLVECAENQLPVICFISSGGMQTKEGAGALFSMAAINDRITRFVRDFDLPVIVFGFGDCTGGAQASFVTHPLVHTYYFSGTSMPFAGQIVIPSHLPAESIIANYLTDVPRAMEGLVKHPFYNDLDDVLRTIDPAVPAPQLSVVEVVDRVLSDLFLGEKELLPMAARASKRRQKKIYRPIKHVLIHARGCAASKLVKVAQDQSIEVVLAQSDPDIDSVAVDMLGPNDSVVCIGGSTPDESYLNARSVLAIAEIEKVDAIHPGIGFLSESSQFAELMQSRGINFIGPPVSSMETMGNKSNAINMALSLDIPVVPGSHGIVTDVANAADVADEIGYPILIKAVHGGGGKGIQVVESANGFHEQFQRVSAEARAAFGNGDLYLEKYITSLRHIEVQILRDRQGTTSVLGLRDCSVQRNKQKIIEESDSTMLSQKLHDSVYEYATKIADAVKYVGAGTVEFIYDLVSDQVYFMEMNTRLQVEHPVTELVSGVDIVSAQFRIAGGEKFAVEATKNGYAIEARINAEKITRDADGNMVLRSSAGEVRVCELPDGPDVQVIAGISSGKAVSPYYDSMIVQIIAHGSDREATAQRLEEYLSNVRIEGIYTNVALVRRILTDPVFLNGDYDTEFLTHFFNRTDVDSLISEVEATANVRSEALDLSTIQIEGSDELKVLAPSTGIFYLRPSPADQDYVAVGDEITNDVVICQLEAFKVFTPMRLKDFNSGDQEFYPDDRKFRVSRINVATGQQVNAGDLLFVITMEQETSLVN